jgi:hypothetical protein
VEPAAVIPALSDRGDPDRAEIRVDGVLDEAVWTRAPVSPTSPVSVVDGPRSVDSQCGLVLTHRDHFGVHAFEPRPGAARHATGPPSKRLHQFFLAFNDGRRVHVRSESFGVQADGALVEQGQVQGGGFMGGAASSANRRIRSDVFGRRATWSAGTLKQNRSRLPLPGGGYADLAAP